MRASKNILWLICLFYLILFLPLIGNVHLFDWDEINFAEAAREMLVTGDWLNIQINYEPFWEKPPLFIWMQAACMYVFGVSEFAARLPNVLVGLVTIICIYKFTINRFGMQAAILSVFLFLGSFTPHLYFKSGIIDPMFNLLIFLSVYQLVRSIDSKKTIAFFWSGLFLGLAVMTKGPAAILIVGLTGLGYQIIYRNNFYSFKKLIYLVFGLLLIPSLWFGLQAAINGKWFIQEFISYQIDLFTNPVASHGQPFYYHAVVLLIGCFPMLILVLPVLFKWSRSKDQPILAWLKVLFWIVLILFSLVTTKIVHYSSMCYLPLAILGGVYFSRDGRIQNYQKALILLVGSVYLIVLSFITYLGSHVAFRDKLIALIDDPFVSAQLNFKESWNSGLMAFGFIGFSLVVYLVLKYSKQRLISFLIFNTLYISVLLATLVPRIEMAVQGEWINHLKTYRGQEMVHFTVGFKSYAHAYYTQVENSDHIKITKQLALDSLGFGSFYALSQEDKQSYNVLLRTMVRDETDIKFSITTKPRGTARLEKVNKSNKLIKVFEGNGYTVWERNDDPTL